MVRLTTPGTGHLLGVIGWLLFGGSGTIAHMVHRLVLLHGVHDSAVVLCRFHPLCEVRALANVRSASVNIFLWTWSFRSLHTSLSLRESSKTAPNLQGAARRLSSATKSAIDSPGSWLRLWNFHRSAMMISLGS